MIDWIQRVVRAGGAALVITMKGPSNRKSGPTAVQRLVLGMLVASGAGLLGIACAAAPRPEVLIHDSPRGRVYLETVPDPSFEATHPISVDPTVITLMLHGVMVQRQERLLQTLLAGPAPAIRVFSDEDAAFLTPYLVTALSTAGPRQLVRFRISDAASGASPELAGGTLYVQGRLMYLSLTHYRDIPGKRENDSKPGRSLPGQPGLENYIIVSFTPERARVRAEDLVATIKEPANTTVVVDSRILAKTVEPERTVLPGRTDVDARNGPELPAQEELQAIKDLVVRQASESRTLKTVEPEQTVLPGRTDADAGDGPAPSTQEELQAMKDLVVRQARENQALKQEVELLRRQLADRNARVRKPLGRGPSGTRDLAPAP